MDLGSGEGQILIAAARDCGARGVGVEIAPALVEKARRTALAAGVAERLEFRLQDFFGADLRQATVLMLYLLDSINVRLRPKILRECRPGTRVVTYSFEMGEWQCDAHTPIAANGVSLWIVPANVSGGWSTCEGSTDSGLSLLSLQQRFQELSGTAVLDGVVCPVIAGRVRGSEFSLAIGGAAETVTMNGRIEGEQMSAQLVASARSVGQWKAARQVASMRPIEPSTG